MKRFLALAVLLVIIALPLAGCKEKTPITKDEFVSIMEEKGAEIKDATSQFDANVVDSVTLAMFENFQIEFFVLNTEDVARSTYATNKSDIENAVSANNVSSSVDLPSNAYLKMTDGDRYSHIIRVGKTFVYVSTTKENKDAVVKNIKALGY